jgi:type IV pilus assembly protein PilX
MQTRNKLERPRARGMVLISALLLLLVMTILGTIMLRSSGLGEKTGGNIREKQRALHVAESAQTYAEWWLSSGAGNNATTGAQCNGTVGTPRVCTNTLQDVVAVPWAAGVSYSPPMLQVAPPGVADGYFAAPSMYIAFVSSTYDPTTGTQTQVYQVDAQGYGGTQNAVAVVESGYSVSVTHTTSTDDTKYLNLGGP